MGAIGSWDTYNEDPDLSPMQIHRPRSAFRNERPREHAAIAEAWRVITDVKHLVRHFSARARDVDDHNADDGDVFCDVGTGYLSSHCVGQ